MLQVKEIKENALAKLHAGEVSDEEAIEEVAAALQFTEDEGYIDLYNDAMTAEETINYLCEVYACVVGYFGEEGLSLGLNPATKHDILIYVNGKLEAEAFMAFDRSLGKNRLYSKDVEDEEE